MRQKLSIENAALAQQWDYDKNKGVTPDMISAGSEYRAFWLCEKHGHSWDAYVYSRNQGRGCPYCANRKVLDGFNDLQTLNPALADEWDYEENNGLTSNDVIAGATQHYSWKCAFGHTWTATAKKRHHDGQNCPYCCGNKVWVGFNDIPTTHPAVASEWNYKRNGKRRPEHYTIGSDIKAWWLCGVCGHEWDARIYSRKKCGCPSCAGNILVVGKNDLRTVNPAVAAEWDGEKNYPIRADDVAANDNRKFHWRCELGHSYDAVVYSRNYGRGCPYCSNHRLLRGFNDLQTHNKTLAMEWDDDANYPLTAADVISTSHNYAYWKCGKGHTWKATIVNRNTLGTGCPKCKHKIASPGETDFATLRRDIAEEWDSENNGDLTAGTVLAQSSQSISWKCRRGHRWNTSPANRYRGTRCPYCVGKLAITGETDAATVSPELKDEWVEELNKGYSLENLKPSSHLLFWWKCQKCSHRWKSSLESRTHGSLCPQCLGRVKRRPRLVM